ncbi:outer membrane beta-barrel protein [Ereboglobus luteus]|uniref:Outer membrane protein beta-barrel domain-containing protein n=1 Tax=Ereboglobus luteus TaxID=1796921 RepID=A0A2U8DZ50_9BACT|nr:outer membrane beta-barrel protein [Ereboglobus luteus]AWI07903.1 hypothetical protein CKA38_00290 [Ereboglobus luteus]
MNPTDMTKTICALFTGLLIASASALAQTTPPTPAQAAGPSHSSKPDSSYAMPKATGPNFYFEVGGTYMKAKTEGQKQDFYGGTIAIGGRLDRISKVQLEIGRLSGDDKHSEPGYSEKNDFTVTTALLSASACIPLGKKEQCELRLTPLAGLYSMKWKVNSSYYGSGNDTDTAFSWGGGAGITYHINTRFYVDAGYRYIRVGSTEYKMLGVKLKLDSMDTHSATVSVGCKF